MDNVGEHVLDTQAGSWGEAPGRSYCLREVPAVQQAGSRSCSRKVRGDAGGGRAAALPKHPQLHEGRLGERDKPSLDQHLLDRAVELLDDPFHHIELLRRPPGNHHVALEINEILGAGEEVRDRSLQCWQSRGQVVDELIELLNFVDGNVRAGGGRCLGRVRHAEFSRQHETLAQPVKAGLLHQFLGVFRIHHPDQLVADLELQIIIAADVPQELAQFHFVQVHTQHLLQGRQRFVGYDVHSRRLAEVDQHRLERNIIQVHGHLLLQHLHHVAFLAFEVEQRAFLTNGFAVAIGYPGRLLDAVHRVPDVLARRQTAILVFGQQALNRGIKSGVLCINGSDFIFYRLLASLLPGLKHPTVNAFHHRVFRRHVPQCRGLGLRLFPMPLVSQVHDLPDLRIVALVVFDRGRAGTVGPGMLARS